MTMISPRHRRSRVTVPTFLTLILLVLVFGAILLWRAQVSALFWRVMSPVVSSRNSFGASLGIFSGQFSGSAALSAENAALRATLASTTALVSDRSALAVQNAILRQQLGRNTGDHVVLAGVLMHSPAVAYDTLLIDAGTLQGVAVGDLVYAAGTTLVGTIAETYDQSSRVELLSTPGQSYQAFLRTTGSAPTTIAVSVEGQGAGSMKAQVPASTMVAAGDQVIFPGIESGFAGVVSHIDVDQSQSFKNIYIQLPVNPQSLEFVEVHI